MGTVRAKRREGGLEKSMPAKRRKRRRKAALKPRMGPATNLRPAGAHKTKKRYSRKRNKAIIASEVDEQA
jgi:hypothetical protein